jgi:chromosome condensin MukBEF ATPase and DNA-binding subunit MukB
MNGRIKRVAYVGWAGIDYEDLDLDDGPFTGLVGTTGAGKTTLLTCFAYALLPDRGDLTLQPISNVADPNESGKDQIAAWISKETNYAYVALDIAGRHGKRLIAGVYAEVKGSKAELFPWTISDADPNATLRSFLVIEEAETEYTPDLVQLREALAKRGITLQRHTVTEYGEQLYEAGVSPTTLKDRGDRTLYGKLIQSSFHGGISPEVAANLKQYILPEAKRIPETVAKVQEVTAQVARTRRALENSKRQLRLLETTFVAGKEVAVRAAQVLITDASGAMELRDGAIVTRDRVVLAEQTAAHAAAAFNAQLETSNKAFESIKASFNAEIARFDEEWTLHDKAVQSRETALQQALERQDAFVEGEQIWHKAAGAKADRDYDAVKQALNQEIEQINEAAGRLSEQYDDLVRERDALASAAGDPRVTALTERLGGTPLAEALSGVSENEAVRLELALGGLTAGLVGVDPSRLAKVEPSGDLPEFFWLGEQAPTPPNAHEVGAWIVARRTDGYVVTSKKHRPVFGAAARAKRRMSLEENIARIDGQRRQFRIDAARITERRDTLQENREMVQTYLANRHDEKRLTDNVENQKRELKAAREQKLVTERARAEQRRRLTEAEVNHRNHTYGLREDIRKQHDAQRDAADRISGANDAVMKSENEVTSTAELLFQGRAALGSHWDFMASTASTVPVLPTVQYAAEQTKLLMELCAAVADEPGRSTRFEEAEALNPVSCLHLWPLLLEVVRNHVPVDVADATGHELLQEMQAKRESLVNELASQENEVRLHASEVYGAIKSELHKQAMAVRRLSKLAEDLQFGNVIGMRVSAVRKDNLLGLLERFADQGSLFTQDQRPFEDVLSDYFSQALNAKVNGEELLDYRSYMDIFIEVKRSWDTQWRPASSLSGGEAIGGGLAITLVLFRSLAMRGGAMTNLRPDQITPLFVIDEMMRLDDQGQDVAVSFGEKQGFQLLVTAPKLSPDYRCTLWSINRFIRDGRPNVVIRGVQRTRDGVVAAAEIEPAAT